MNVTKMKKYFTPAVASFGFFHTKIQTDCGHSKHAAVPYDKKRCYLLLQHVASR